MLCVNSLIIAVDYMILLRALLIMCLFSAAKGEADLWATVESSPAWEWGQSL